jgi:hypothetical protein
MKRHVIWLAFLLAAMPVRSEDQYVGITCKAFGRYAHCTSHNAADLAEPVWVYSSKPAYQVYGLKAIIEIKQKEWTPLTFYATDAVRTHVVSIQIRLVNHRATFCNPAKENCREKK